MQQKQQLNLTSLFLLLFVTVAAGLLPVAVLFLLLPISPGGEARPKIRQAQRRRQ